MFAEPELVQRQPEWDRQLESIDSQELEIHQSQLRLMRDQTSVFVRDLEALRREVLALHSVQGEVQAIDAGLRELRETVKLDGAKRDASRARFERCLCFELEQVLGAQLHTSLEADRDSLSPELVTRDKALEPSQGSVLGRLSRLEVEVQGPTSEKLSRFHRDIQELREVIGGEKLTWEMHTTTIQGTLEDAHSRHMQLSDRFADLERLLAESSLMHSKELVGLRARLDTHHTSGAERLLQLEAAVREADASRAAELEELRSGCARTEAEVIRLAGDLELVGSMHARRVEEVQRGVESEVQTIRARVDKVTAAILATAGIVVDDHESVPQALIPERMDYLESMMGASFDKHERMLEQTKDDVQKIFVRLSACDGTCEALSERLAHKLHAEPTRHEKDLEAVRSEQSALARDLQVLVAGEVANAKSAMDERVAGLKESVQHLHVLLGSHVEQQEVEMGAIRKADVRHSSERAAFTARLVELEHGLAAAGGGCEELLTAVRTECTRQGARLGELSNSQDRLTKESHAMEELCRSLRDRLDGLEASFDTHAGRQAGELQSVSSNHARQSEELARSQADFERLHGRLEACERDGTALRELLVAHDGLAGAFATRDTELEHSAQRLDAVQRLVNQAAETSAKALVTAHAGMEKLRGRLLSIESQRHALENLHEDLAEDKAANDARLAALEGRVDGLGWRLGDAWNERAKELEATLNVRVTTLESRLEGLGRRVTEAAGERARDLQATLDERLAPLEGRLEDMSQQPDDQIRGEGGQDLEARLEFMEDLLVKSKEAHSEELELLKATLAAHAGELESINMSIAERLEGINQALGESVNKHAKDIAVAHAKLQHFDSRLSACEEHSTTMGETRNTSASLSIDSLDSLCETLKERVDVIDGALADSTRRCFVELNAIKDVQESHAREVEARMEAFEGYISGTRDAHAKEMESVRALCADHSKELRSMKAAPAPNSDLAERLGECEQGLLESGAEHAESIAAIHAMLEHLGSRLGGFEGQNAALGDLRKANMVLTNDKTALESLCESLKERVDSIDSAVADAAHRHSHELEAAKAAQDRQCRDLEAHKAAQGRQQAALAERLEAAEASLRDAHEHHADGLAGAHEAIEHLRGRAEVWDQHGSTVAELQKALGGRGRERAELDARHASLEERLGEADQALKEARARMEKLCSRLSACERQGGELKGQQAALADGKALLESQFATVKTRVDCLGEALGDCFDRHIWELETVQENATSSDSQVRHPTVEDRLRQLEAALAEAAGRQTRQQEAVRAQLRELQQRNAQEHEAREAWQDSFQECMNTEKTARNEHLRSVDTRFKAFEDALGTAEERHSRELAALKSTHSSHAERLEAACSRVDQLEHGFVEERTARSEAGVSLEQRLTSLDHSIGESAARHAEALQAHQASFGQHVGPLEERLSELSQFYQEAVQDRAKQAQLDDSIVQQLQDEKKARELQELGHQNQLAMEAKAREAVQSKLDQLEKELAEERAARDGAGEQLRERVGRLEGRVGELSQPQLEEPRAAEVELGERLDRLERKLAELLERCEESAAERARWAELDHALELQVQDEKRAREAAEAELRAEFALERGSRESHERLVQEQFLQDREAHERFQDRLQDILARETEVRERRFEGYEEALQHEARARDACTQELRELLAMERTLHEEHHASSAELLRQAERQRQSEGEDEGERFQALRERVQALQQEVTVCDSMMRQEIQARCKDSMRLWEAIAVHSHDQAPPAEPPETGAPEAADAEAPPAEPPETGAPEAADAEVTDAYVPFPCQPLTSFLRLGGQGLPERERRRRIRLFSPSSRSASPRSVASAPNASPGVASRRGRRKEVSF